MAPPRRHLPAEHKVGGTGRLFLPWELIANASYRYSDVSDIHGTLGVSRANDYHRLDLTLSRPLPEGRGEVLIGVADVFDDSDIDVAAIGSLTAHEVPGRTFFGRVQIRF